MSTASTSFKLGLFTILAVAGLFVTALTLGVRGAEQDTIEYHTYFDESVTGLEIGAPLRLRGLKIGTISKIAFAPDGRHVDVTAAVETIAAPKIAWTPGQDNGLRAQLTPQGITGVKLVDIDIVDPSAHPPPSLTFEPAPRYVPATKSLLTRLEESVGQAVERLPEIVEASVATLHRLELIFQDVDNRHLPARVGATLDGLNVAVGDLRGIMGGIDRGKIPERTASALERLEAAIESAGRVIERVGGDGGLITSAQRATDSLGRLGQSATGTTQDLDRTLRDLSDAARSVREVTEALERDPDMLIKGRSKAKTR